MILRGNNVIGVLFFALVCMAVQKVSSGKTTIQYIGEMGLTHQIHEVVTSDGYKLKLFRIPNPGKEVVLCMHGIFTSSNAFVVSGNKSLAFHLNAEFDVWLGNFRGNPYSNSHSTYSYNSTGFWNFSFHEMGTIDVPAMIDFILINTTKPNLNYIGYSMGGHAYFVMNSLKSAYPAKIKQFHGIGTGASIASRTPSLLNPIYSWDTVKMWFLLQTAFTSVLKCGTGPSGVFPTNGTLLAMLLGGFTCKDSLGNGACSNVPLLILNKPEISLNGLLTTTEMSPYSVLVDSPTSWKNVHHYLQILASNVSYIQTFCSSISSPAVKYNFSASTAPSYFYNGDIDKVATPLDAINAFQAIPNGKQKIVIAGYRHGDYMINQTAYTKLVQPLIQNLKTP